MSVLQAIANDLWLAEGPNVTFFGFPYSTRMVIARLPEGLWVWSPITLNDELRAQVDALGPVRWLVSPNKIHHIFMGDWHSAYPTSKLCGLPQVVRKRDDLAFEIHLDNAPPPAWAEHIDQVIFRGSIAMEEITFLHRSSGTAIFGDLIENFEQAFLDANWKRWQARCAHFIGITAPNGRAPLDYRASFIRRSQAREALAKVLAWAPKRVLMAHGTWIDAIGPDGQADDKIALEFLKRSFSWLS